MVSYAESGSEGDEDDEVFKPLSGNGRASKRRKVVLEESDDEFGMDAATEHMMAEEGMSKLICNVTVSLPVTKEGIVARTFS